MIDILIYVFAFGFTGILMYSLLRYGPVEHSWLNITPDETKEMNRLNKEYWTINKFSKPVPQGQPLYKKKMVGHNGIVIHNNGIMAKFCIGRKGKYRFVPFKNITGIYPVIIYNPMAKSDSKLMGLASWKELQIETEDFMVYLIGSRAHNFEDIIPLIKKAMGPQWDAVYHENEVIEARIPEGDALRHKYLRGETVPAVPITAPTTAPDGSPSPPINFIDHNAELKPLEGYGALLAQESEKDIQERKASMLKGFLILFAMGAGMLGVAVIFAQSLSLIMMFVLIIFGCVMILIGMALFNASKKTEPMKIYENGILQPYLVGQNNLFIPYGRIVSISEIRNFIDGDMIVLKTKDNQTIGFRKNSPEVMAQMDMIRGKINNPGYDYNLQNEIQPAMGGKLGTIFILLAPVVSLFLSVFMTYYIYGTDQGSNVYVMGLVLLWPGLTFIFLTFTLVRFRKNARIFGKRPDFKIPIAIVVALLLFFVVGEAYLLNEPSSTSSGPYDIVPMIETMPDISVLAGSIYENTNLHINGSILVDSGRRLEIRNSTVNFHGIEHKDSSIWTAEGSELILDNCILGASSSSAYYSFEVFGTLLINNCSISGVWGDMENENYEGGIEIYSPDARIINTNIYSPVTNGIMAINASLELQDTTIVNAFDDAIEIRNSTVLADNCTLSDNGWAMVIEQGSNVTLTNCLIDDNSNGIAAARSALIVHDCEFTGNSEYAIKYASMDYVEISGNTFTSNDMDIDGSTDTSSSIVLCNSITFLTGIICILAIIYSHKATDNV
ncbi:MAG: right-handed parallel beta-helix repeat-containing protein [Thermoplasmata archaeon]|nr:right-handed parallel beta-helix repeat-containing protein [Thermoplasmata archaeon]